jgi:uncharacterized membrane protein
MNNDTHRYTRELTAVFAAATVFFTLPAHADFDFSTVDYPGVDYSAGGYTELFGIDNDGSAVGNAQLNASSPTFPFRYDIKRHLFIRLPDYASGTMTYTLANGINNGGTIVGGESQDGGTTEFAYVLKQGVFELLSRPGSRTFTEARAVNAHGLVSGYALNDADGTYSGFIYDPVSNTWTAVLPSLMTIAQGLNRRDEVVGSVFENADIVCGGCQAGPYGFIRAPSGFVAIFTVNGVPTKARGITDAGTIAGFVIVEDYDVGFVIPAPKHPGFQVLSVLEKDLVLFPGAAGTGPEAIADDGTLAGFWTDKSGATHGFIAAPRSLIAAPRSLVAAPSSQ